jgi:hypothetical protein
MRFQLGKAGICVNRFHEVEADFRRARAGADQPKGKAGLDGPKGQLVWFVAAKKENKNRWVVKEFGPGESNGGLK